LDRKARDAGCQNLLERFTAARAGYKNAKAYHDAKEQQRNGN
jgi:hypothetical protein